MKKIFMSVAIVAAMMAAVSCGNNNKKAEERPAECTEQCCGDCTTKAEGECCKDECCKGECDKACTDCTECTDCPDCEASCSK